jgi:hypothetical protein
VILFASVDDSDENRLIIATKPSANRAAATHINTHEQPIKRSAPDVAVTPEV